MQKILNLTLGLLALFSALLAGVPAATAQAIVNTAAARWTGNTGSFQTASNTVSLTLAPEPAHMILFRLSDAGEQKLSFPLSQCGEGVIAIPGNNGPTFESAKLEETAQVRKGEFIFLRVAEPLLNRNPAMVEPLGVVATSAAGDRETFTIYETAPNSGIFAGAIGTAAIPPSPAVGDCKISARTGDRVTMTIMGPEGSESLVSGVVDVLADPVGIVFDSETGAPVDGAKVTLIDEATGAPAQVFGDDGTTTWPATIISGQEIADGKGKRHEVRPGQFRFPRVRYGNYRLRVEPPSPMIAPSGANPATLAGLLSPDGEPYSISPASFGKPFAVNSMAAMQIDVPVDLPPASVQLSMAGSRASALPGDVVIFTVNLSNPHRDRAVRNGVLITTPSKNLRFRPETVRIDGVTPPSGTVVFAPDGTTMTVNLGDIPAGRSYKLTYAMSVRADANAGGADSRVTFRALNGISATAGVSLRIEREDLASRAVLIGRIIASGCEVSAATGAKNEDRKVVGIPNVRIVMEDGSFAISDADGRYHFQGVTPGNHVLQAVPSTLPVGGRFMDCTRSTRSTGSAISRFVSAQGGMVAVTDFHAILPEAALNIMGSTDSAANAGIASAAAATGTTNADADSSGTAPGTEIAATVVAPANAALMSASARAALSLEELRAADDADSRRAAGAETDWMAAGPGPTEFLFPTAEHNPRAPAVRVVIRHRQDEKIELQAEGKRVDSVSLDSVTNSSDGQYTISIWRGIPLTGEDTRLTAVVRDMQGAVVTTLTRDVHFSSTPARAELLADRSKLVADGTTRPVVALRLLDRKGRPVHSGLTGELTLSSPYESAEAVEARQTRSITGGSDQAGPRWMVRGDDGVALVELAPTMVSGKLRMAFEFMDAQQRREQEIDAWIEPGDQPWTVVGLVEGGVGSRKLADTMQRTKPLESDLGDNARIALYVKGQIAKGLLATGSYDSAKQRDEQQLMGTLDARAYYSVFADNSDRRHDAASRDKLYLRLEGKGFSGFYGDFQAGFDQTQLGRYQRAATGVRVEATSGGLQTVAFAARIASTHRRDEIQGAGITGPYRLSSRAIIPGSERVQLEIRDRFRSELIVTRKPLDRFADYEIDLLSGTITFRQPILSRDDSLNPQFVVIDYEVDESARGGEVNAGVRTTLTTANGKLRIGATGLTDTSTDDGERTHLAAVDVRGKIGNRTELRAEVARSINDKGNANAWIVEAEHHSGQVDLLAYARSSELRFGVGQMSGAERGRRKLGLDARYRVTEDLSINASAWNDTSLGEPGERNAARFEAVFRNQRTDARIGFSTMQDSQANGPRQGTTALELGAAQRLFDNKLEISAATSLALGQAKAADLPNRHRLNLRYAITNNLRVTGSYEIAKGEKTETRTARGGLELTPWNGARISTTIGKEEAANEGKRAFASVGLSQSLQLSPRLMVDASVENARTLGGLYARRFNPGQPNSSGGTLGDGDGLAGDFTAVSLGANWRGGRWVLTGRGEFRNGEQENRRGLLFSMIRQMGEGSMLGGTFSIGHTRTASGSSSRTFNSALALAYRPNESNIAMLGKLELRSDKLDKTKPGEQIAGNALSVAGDAMSTRVIGSFTADWTPYGQHEGNMFQRSGIGFFGAVRYNFDTVDGMTLDGTTLLSGINARLGIGEHFEVGGRATVRASLSDGTTNYSTGPEIGVSPMRDVLLTFGYNVTGYYDRDFTAAKYTNDGPYAGIRLKFDANTFSFLNSGM